MKYFGVIGNPIIHSKSPDIMGTYFKIYDIKGYYTRIAVDDVIEVKLLFDLLLLNGINVTSPFKESIISIIDDINDDARFLNSVNTVIKKDGKLYGYNTDIDGVKFVFNRYGIDIKEKKVAIIGLGGAGRTCAYVLKSMGAEVILLNRTEKKAAEFAIKLGCSWSPLENLEWVVRNSDIVISALPQKINLIKKEWVDKNKLLMDVNYKNSIFQELDNSKKCIVMNSFYWLIGQSIPAFEKFVGIKPELDDKIINGIMNLKKEINTICIIGFMATGKSTVGRLLSKRLGWEFVDLDDFIEEKTGKMIKDIFQIEGENKFREYESNAIRENLGKRKIISCGGGIIVREKNRKLLKDKCFNIWIVNSIDESLKRVRGDTRPLLNVKDQYKKAHELFKSRLEYYFDVADLVILNENKSIDSVVDRLYEEINFAIGSKR